MQQAPIRGGALVLIALFVAPAGLAAAPGVAPDPAVAAWLDAVASGELEDACAEALAAEPGAFPLVPVAAADAVNPAPLELVNGCTGIRPGAALGNGCTMNFVFTDGAQVYVGTAGHCTSSVGQRHSTPGVGTFGTVVYRLNAGIGSDFALIRVDADKVHLVNPQMCVWGGPSNGAHSGNGVGSVLLHYGQGFLTNWNPVTKARAHVVMQQGTNSAQWAGVGSGGDSGSPVMTSNGEAYAILTHGATPAASTFLYGTYIQRALSLSRAAGFNVQVVSGEGILPDLPVA